MQRVTHAIRTVHALVTHEVRVRRPSAPWVRIDRDVLAALVEQARGRTDAPASPEVAHAALVVAQDESLGDGAAFPSLRELRDRWAWSLKRVRVLVGTETWADPHKRTAWTAWKEARRRERVGAARGAAPKPKIVRPALADDVLEVDVNDEGHAGAQQGHTTNGPTPNIETERAREGHGSGVLPIYGVKTQHTLEEQAAASARATPALVVHKNEHPKVRGPAQPVLLQRHHRTPMREDAAEVWKRWRDLAAASKVVEPERPAPSIETRLEEALDNPQVGAAALLDVVDWLWMSVASYMAVERGRNVRKLTRAGQLHAEANSLPSLVLDPRTLLPLLPLAATWRARGSAVRHPALQPLVRLDAASAWSLFLDRALSRCVPWVMLQYEEVPRDEVLVGLLLVLDTAPVNPEEAGRWRYVLTRDDVLDVVLRRDEDALRVAWMRHYGCGVVVAREAGEAVPDEEDVQDAES